MKYFNVLIILIVFLIFEYILDIILDYDFVNQSNYWLSIFGVILSLPLVAYLLTILFYKRKSIIYP